MMTTAEILREDKVRREARLHDGPRDPIIGRCEPGRRFVMAPVEPRCQWVPESMFADPEFEAAQADPGRWVKLRLRHDFEFWAATAIRIKHKTRPEMVPFVLNRAQLHVLRVLESDRLAGRPIRMILLKARQWGGSTLIQFYMAWIQCIHRKFWNSVIIAHVKDSAAGIRGMYSRALDDYPEEHWPDGVRPEFRCYERSQNVRMIAGRDCRVTIGSYENLDAIRGSDISMAHISEMAFFTDTGNKSPEDCVRAVCGSVPLVPYSVVVMESTANGVGNYFHSEWLRCKDGKGDKHAVFVPWYYLDLYTLPLPDGDRAAFAESMSEYEQRLWHMGLDLDQINWYRRKSREYSSPEVLHAEFPTTDTEAFASTTRSVFAVADIEDMRRDCRTPLRGEIRCPARPEFEEDPKGCFSLWEYPECGQSFLVTVDIGGRSARADWSVICVMSLSPDGGPMEVVGQWRGHCEHYLLADTAAAIARYYNSALLVVESNSLERERSSGEEAGDDASLFMLNRLSRIYPRLYRRETYDRATQQRERRLGFHTNRQTKSMLVAALVEAVRTHAYIERDNAACDELMTYAQDTDGSYGALPGYHDDILITRAMAVHLASSSQVAAMRSLDFKSGVFKTNCERSA